MKNAKKFLYAKYNTLTKDEWDELLDFIYKICDNHKDDKWWKVDNCIRACVNNALSARASNDKFVEDCEDEK